MSTFQLEICFGVIKEFTVELDHLGITTFMIGMADAATDVAYLLGAAVIALLCLNILFDGRVVVAIQTQFVLGLLAET